MRLISPCIDAVTFQPGGLTLVLGGSGSGKSALAEDWAVLCRRQPGGSRAAEPMLYVATMQPYPDGETQRRIARHREQRRGKGFETLEWPRWPGDEAADRLPRDRVILLDCLGNLTANQMFAGPVTLSGRETVAALADPLIRMARASRHLIVVSNLIFSDAVAYDSDTAAYRCALGELHIRLAAAADRVIEVCCGVPRFYKGGCHVSG